MKAIVILVSIFAVVTGEVCFKNTKKACEGYTEIVANCTAAYGLAHNYMRDLQIYANVHLTRNFEYLLMSSHFGNYRKNREGFKKLYRKLSDTAWEDAIDLIKYITMRGGKMDFHYDDEDQDATRSAIAMTELESLAKSVDIQKKLAVKAHAIYKAAHTHDPEVGDYVEDKFMHKHAETIRNLVGHTKDLSRMLEGEKDSSSVGLKLYVLDSYLEKVV